MSQWDDVGTDWDEVGTNWDDDGGGRVGGSPESRGIAGIAGIGKAKTGSPQINAEGRRSEKGRSPESRGIAGIAVIGKAKPTAETRRTVRQIGRSGDRQNNTTEDTEERRGNGKTGLPH